MLHNENDEMYLVVKNTKINQSCHKNRLYIKITFTQFIPRLIILKI